MLKNILRIALSLIALVLCWGILSFCRILSPQFQMRPAAKLAAKLFDEDSVDALYSWKYDDWTYQGHDYMLWDKLTGADKTDSGSETGETE